MLARVENVLALAVLHGHDRLVLGAWGCGVFANDAASVAGWFASHLHGGGRFARAFRTVVFAVLDGTADGSNIGPFKERFAVRSS